MTQRKFLISWVSDAGPAYDVPSRSFITERENGPRLDTEEGIKAFENGLEAEMLVNVRVLSTQELRA